MHRVVLDLERLKYPYSGLGQFCRHFGTALLAESEKANLETLALAARGSRSLLPTGTRFLWAQWWRKEFVQRRLRSVWGNSSWAPDLWHMTHHQSHYLPDNINTPLLLTIHDLKFLHLDAPEEISRKLSQLQATVDRAVAVGAISRAVEQDIATHLNLRGKPLRVIHNGVYPEGSIRASTPAIIPQRPFLYSIGMFERKKNFTTLVSMMEHLPDYHLVMSGDCRTDYGRFVETTARNQAWSDRVIFTGLVSDSQRQWYYDHCAAFVFPSVAEGFGLPVLEAMSAGRPVVLANHTSLPEVGGSAARYWTSFDSQSMAKTVRACIAEFASDSTFGPRLVEHARRFSWRATAQRYVEWYQEIIAARTEKCDGKKVA